MRVNLVSNVINFRLCAIFGMKKLLPFVIISPFLRKSFEKWALHETLYNGKWVWYSITVRYCTHFCAHDIVKYSVLKCETLDQTGSKCARCSIAFFSSFLYFFFVQILILCNFIVSTSKTVKVREEKSEWERKRWGAHGKSRKANLKFVCYVKKTFFSRDVRPRIVCRKKFLHNIFL